jgi:hypothetical protein
MKTLLTVVALAMLVACNRTQPSETEQSAPADAQGTQAAAGCAPDGGPDFICGLRNPEDLVLVPGTRWLLASGMEAGSGLNAIDTQAKAARSLFAGGLPSAPDVRYAACPAPLDPQVANLHGLSLRPGLTASDDGRYTLYATNHGGRESIEVFTVSMQGDGPSVAWIGCVLMPEGLAANSVAAFTDGTIVATVLTMPGTTFEDLFAQRPTGAVFMWSPGSDAFRQLPGTELAGNNGIETSADDREFFVAASGGKQIVAYSRTDPSEPLRIARLTEFAPDNVRLIDGNRLITAGMIDDEPECGGAPKTPEGIRCNRGYIVDVIDPQTMAVTELARGPRTPAFTGHAIAIPVGDELWLGSFNADRVAYRPLR